MKNLKRNSIIVVVLLFVCLAVYLNMSYNDKWGKPDEDMVMKEDEAMALSNEEYENALSLGKDEAEPVSAEEMVSEYFASARLTRQQSRDEALTLLQTAASTENASQEIIDSVMNEISVMATWSMREAQMENLLMAKDFAECVVFMSDEEITVAVPAPPEGLTAASVARITDVITGESGVSATQIKIIEVKSSLPEDMGMDTLSADVGEEIVDVIQEDGTQGIFE